MGAGPPGQDFPLLSLHHLLRGAFPEGSAHPTSLLPPRRPPPDGPAPDTWAPGSCPRILAPRRARSAPGRTSPLDTRLVCRGWARPGGPHSLLKRVCQDPGVLDARSGPRGSDEGGAGAAPDGQILALRDRSEGQVGLREGERGQEGAGPHLQAARAGVGWGLEAGPGAALVLCVSPETARARPAPPVAPGSAGPNPVPAPGRWPLLPGTL